MILKGEPLPLIDSSVTGSKNIQFTFVRLKLNVTFSPTEMTSGKETF